MLAGLTRSLITLHRTSSKQTWGRWHIIRLGLPIQSILHRPNAFRTCTGEAPLFALPWLQGVFLAPGARVHLTRPRPTGVQASGRQAIASSSDPAPLGVCYRPVPPRTLPACPLTFVSPPSRLRSVSAPGRPSSTNRCRVRWTMESPTRKVATVSSSVSLRRRGAAYGPVPLGAWNVRLATLRRKSMVQPMLDDGESSNTKFGFHGKKKVGRG